MIQYMHDEHQMSASTGVLYLLYMQYVTCIKYTKSQTVTSQDQPLLIVGSINRTQTGNKF